VITTVSSPEKGALATAAGAHHVVDYKAGDAAAEIQAIAPDGVDLIVEVAPAQNAELNQAVARNRASVAVYANNGGDTVTLPVVDSFVKNLRYQFLLLYTVGQEALDAARADIHLALIDGALPVGEEAGLPITRFARGDAAIRTSGPRRVRATRCGSRGGADAAGGRGVPA
jgi:NADPH2:quinone reductase